MDKKLHNKNEILTLYKIPSKSISSLIAGGLYFEEMNGIPFDSYWNETKPTLRDEFFFMVHTMFGLMNLIKSTKPNNEWLIEYEVAFLIQSKMFSQNIFSIDKLAQSQCYIDAFVICRTMLSRVNLLTMFSLKPSICDNWLREPSNKQFIDGNVRKELKKNNLPNFDKTYKYLSELIHGQFIASANAGMMEHGLFPNLKSLENKIYIISKILLAMPCYGLLSLLVIDQGKLHSNENIQEYELLFEHYFEDTLAFNKLEHFFLMNEDMDLVHVRGNNYAFTNPYDFKHYREYLLKHYKNTLS